MIQGARTVVCAFVFVGACASSSVVDIESAMVAWGADRACTADADCTVVDDC